MFEMSDCCYCTVLLIDFLKSYPNTVKNHAKMIMPYRNVHTWPLTRCYRCAIVNIQGADMYNV